jgi:uncharacterized membrane protein YfcA
LVICSISTGKRRDSKKEGKVYDAIFLHKVKHPFSICFFAIAVFWLIWFYYTSPNTLVLLEQNWPVSLTMVFGSFIAGATSEGGGAIAFPVFTKILHVSPHDAKIFSLAIQSVGMTAASLTIILLGIKVQWRMLFWASIGGVPGILISSLFLDFVLAPALIKMSFTAVVSSFAVTLVILRLKNRSYSEGLKNFKSQEKLILLIAGFIGGVMSGLVGNGIDIICFSVMVLLFRIKESVATPTSVILMAINAIIGFALHALYLKDFTPMIQNYWLAAVPVVIMGAPFGAIFCSRLNSKTIALILITLITVELISSLWVISLNKELIFISTGIGLFFSGIYYLMSNVDKYNVE